MCLRVIDMDRGYIKSGSANIYYELHGTEGDYLVLLHGNAESMKRMKHQIEYFSKDHRVLAIDSRGHGESGFGQGTLNLGTMALDVENVITELGIKKVNVLGFSDGANIAMLLAVKCPELIDSLILIGGNMTPWGMKLGALAAVKAAYYMTAVAGRFDARLKTEHEYYFLMAKEPSITADMLKRIRARTLVIAGSKDMIREKHTRLIAESIPNAQLDILDGDHFIIYRTPRIINERADRFLKGTAE